MLCITFLLFTVFICVCFQLPAVNPNARLLRPAVPVLPNEGNWPLLTVSKSVFEGAVAKG